MTDRSHISSHAAGHICTYGRSHMSGHTLRVTHCRSQAHIRQVAHVRSHIASDILQVTCAHTAGHTCQVTHCRSHAHIRQVTHVRSHIAGHMRTFGRSHMSGRTCRSLEAGEKTSYTYRRSHIIETVINNVLYYLLPMRRSGRS